MMIRMPWRHSSLPSRPPCLPKKERRAGSVRHLNSVDGFTAEEKREELGLSTAQLVLQEKPAASRFAAIGLLLVIHGSPPRQLAAALTVGMREVHLVRPQRLLDRLSPPRCSVAG